MFNSERLRRLRKEAGLIQSDMAAKLNIRRETYTKYETGAINPPSDMILALANLFAVSADYLLNNTNDPTPPDRKHIQQDVDDDDDPEIVTIQRLRKNMGPVDREKMMNVLKAMFAEDFPKDKKKDEEKENDVQK